MALVRAMLTGATLYAQTSMNAAPTHSHSVLQTICATSATAAMATTGHTSSSFIGEVCTDIRLADQAALLFRAYFPRADLKTVLLYTTSITRLHTTRAPNSCMHRTHATHRHYKRRRQFEIGAAIRPPRFLLHNCMSLPLGTISSYTRCTQWNTHEHIVIRR